MRNVARYLEMAKIYVRFDIVQISRFSGRVDCWDGFLKINRMVWEIGLEGCCEAVGGQFSFEDGSDKEWSSETHLTLAY